MTGDSVPLVVARRGTSVSISTLRGAFNMLCRVDKAVFLKSSAIGALGELLYLALTKLVYLSIATYTNGPTSPRAPGARSRRERVIVPRSMGVGQAIAISPLGHSIVGNKIFRN